MFVLNLGHPLSPSHLEQIAVLTGQAVDRVLDVKTQFDPTPPYAAQARALVDSMGLSGAQWQTTPILVNPPGHNTIACVVLAELHGRTGYFPPVVRLRQVSGSVPPWFEVAEIIDLQAVRELARGLRAGKGP